MYCTKLVIIMISTKMMSTSQVIVDFVAPQTPYLEHTSLVIMWFMNPHNPPDNY